MKDYYTYVYLDPRKTGSFIYENYSFENEPFYVGKGHKNRSESHVKGFSNYNLYKLNKIKAIMKAGMKPIVIKIHKQVSEKYAFEKEKELIKVIGRHDMGTGPLTNLTDGGEGTTGRKDSGAQLKKKSKITKKLWKDPVYRKKITDANTGENNPFYNKQHTEETKANLSVKAQNRTLQNRKKLGWNRNGEISEEHKRLISKRIKESAHKNLPVKVYVYAIDKTPIKIFECKADAKKEFQMITRTLNKYINSDKMYKGCYMYDYPKHGF